MKTSQIMATTMFFLNNKFNRDFVQEWYNIGVENSYQYLTDAPSMTSNWGGFCEHRHDQSIFSLLVKTHGQYCAIPDETRFVDNWHSDGAGYPIWVTRNPTSIFV